MTHATYFTIIDACQMLVVFATGFSAGAWYLDWKTRLAELGTERIVPTYNPNPWLPYDNTSDIVCTERRSCTRLASFKRENTSGYRPRALAHDYACAGHVPKLRPRRDLPSLKQGDLL